MGFAEQDVPPREGGGFIWAPLADRRGKIPHHWSNVASVKRGDTVFSYYRGSIVARGFALSDSYRAQKPIDFDADGLWEDKGNRVDIDYEDLHEQIVVKDISRELSLLLDGKYSPLTKRFSGVQGYLFSVSEAVGELLDRRSGRCQPAA